jgi:RNA polymerase subunit RPABC4/transcription elongation factor Spt4
MIDSSEFKKVKDKATKPCPRCGHEKLTAEVSGYPILLMYQNQNALADAASFFLGLPTPSHSVPCVLVICENCNYIMLHAGELCDEQKVGE